MPSANRSRIHFLLLPLVCSALLSLPKAGLSQDTVLVGGSQWMNGQGVDAFDNGTDPSVGRGSNSVNGVYVGIKWQCVELAQRLYTVRGWYSGAFRSRNGTLVDIAYHIYDIAGDMNMIAHPNGDGNVPVPGDMIILQGTTADSAGHVSVVDRVDANAVYTVEQNWPYSNDRCSYARSGTNGSFLKRLNTGYSVRGFVHSPQNPNGPSGGSFDPANPYVDAGFGGTQIGTAANPFKTVMQAINAASATQSVIHIKPGVYGEKIGTSKHIQFVTWGAGTVRIGG